MKKFDLAKAEYLEVKASKELEEKVEEVLKGPKKTYYLRRAAFAAVFVAVVSVTVLNVFPSIAYSVQDIPILGRAIKVVTFREYKNEEKEFKGQVVVPEIEGLLDKELEEQINREFKENAEYVIAAYEKDVKALQKEFGDEDVSLKITSSYQIKTDNETILALDVYIVNEVGSSSTKHSFYNINKKTGELLSLEKLFGKDFDYVTKISDYIKKEMKRRNAEEDGMYWIEGEENAFEPFNKIDKNQNFYINDKGNVVICFDKYEVAPGAQGCPEFELPEGL